MCTSSPAHNRRCRSRGGRAARRCSRRGPRCRRSALHARARGLLLRRRQAHCHQWPHIHGGPDVRGRPHSGETDATLSHHHGPRRHPLRHDVFRYARWPRRLGAIFRAPGLCGLRCRSARPWTVRLPCRVVRPLEGAGWRWRPAPLPLTGQHTQWPGSGAPDDAITLQMTSGYLPEIENFTKQQFLNRDALVALIDQIGPAILMVHSQAGAFGWPVADGRPDQLKAILAVEPNGPPFYQVDFTGAPDYFKQGPLALPYGLSAVPLTYSPAVADAKDLAVVQQEQADGPDLVKCHLQRETARKLANLKMPILVVMSEASYHAPYDHCTVKYLRQAGAHPTFMRLADIGIKGNSHVMMNEKNNKEIAAAIAQWTGKTLPGKE